MLVDRICEAQEKQYFRRFIMNKQITLSVSLAGLLFLAGCGSDQTNTAQQEQAVGQYDFAKIELRHAGDIHHAPVVVSESYTIDKDTNLTETLQATDEDNDTITYSIIEFPSNGTVELNRISGLFTYSPNQDFVGTDLFKFQAKDEHNITSEDGNITINVIDQSTEIPNAPTDLISTGTTNTSIDLSWTDNSTNETGFVICQDGKIVKTVAANQTSVTIDGLKEGKEYKFKIKAKNEAGCSSSSNSIKVTTDNSASAPVAPTNLKVVAKSKTCVRLTWEDNADNENGYKIYQDGDLIKTVAANTKCKTISGLTSGSSHTFVVEAFNDVGEARSNEANVTLAAGNSVPVAYGKTYSTYNDTNLTRKLCAYDGDGDSLTYDINTTGLSGEVSVDENGTFTYVPESDFKGTTSFIFTASDENSTSEAKEIKIKVCDR
jgi:hypothetical protein